MFNKQIKLCLKQISELFISNLWFYCPNMNKYKNFTCIFYKFYFFIFRHPLFPLLALLFERCEQATQSATISNSDNFNMDIQAFVQHQERDRKPFLINDTEIDGLVCIQNIFF